MKTYLNVSGRLLSDGNGNDWPALKRAKLDPDTHYTRGLLAYGHVREDGAAPAEAPAQQPALSPADMGTVATVLPTSADVPMTEQPAPANPTADKKGARK